MTQYGLKVENLLVIYKTDQPRSYIVQSGKKCYTRNRMHLIFLSDFKSEIDMLDDTNLVNKNIPGVRVSSPVKSNSLDSQVLSTNHSKLFYPSFHQDSHKLPVWLRGLSSKNNKFKKKVHQHNWEKNSKKKRHFNFHFQNKSQMVCNIIKMFHRSDTQKC